MDNNYLMHHGILGMKWGIRRFQNKDGSLTAKGKKRYNDKDEPKEETVEERRARVLKSTDAKEIYKNRNLLTTNEINERLTRIDTEARLAKVADGTKKTGIDYVNSKMESTTKTINNAKNLFKSVDEAYSTVSNSAIGRTIAKKLGLEPPKKEFNLNDFWKNKNTKSNKEMQEVSQRLANERKIEEEINRRKKAAEKEKSKQDSDNKAKNDSKAKETESNNSNSSKDEKVHTGTVEGKGTSRFDGWKDKGKNYVDAEFEDIAVSKTKKTELLSSGRDYVAALPDVQIAGLLESKKDDR